MAPKVRLSLRLRRRSVIVAQTITKDQSLEARMNRKKKEEERSKRVLSRITFKGASQASLTSTDRISKN